MPIDLDIASPDAADEFLGFIREQIRTIRSDLDLLPTVIRNVILLDFCLEYTQKLWLCT